MTAPSTSDSRKAGGSDTAIRIHGTTDPGSIGRAVSNGCIRMPDEVIQRLRDTLPLGTPVLISG